MKPSLLIFATLTLLFSGCGHQTMRGNVAMKVSDTEAHVCMNSNEVNVGDKVTLFRNNCSSKEKEAVSSSGGCEKVNVGEGKVTKILNDHYSVVEFAPGVKFAEGNFVEKVK